MNELSKKKRVRQRLVHLGLATWFAVGVSVAPVAMADPTTPIAIQGSALESSGASWFPDIPLTLWSGFSLSLPGSTEYVDSTASVATTLTASVIDPLALSVSYPKNRVPDVVYVIDGAGDELDEPMTIGWANVQGYPAGESHLVYVYDAATGLWSVAGAATVSADGTTLVQPDVTHNTAVTYYFVDQNVLLTWPPGS